MNVESIQTNGALEGEEARPLGYELIAVHTNTRLRFRLLLRRILATLDTFQPLDEGEKGIARPYHETELGRYEHACLHFW